MDSNQRFSPPYGPPANAIAVLKKWRDHSVPDQVTKEWLSKIGLSPNLAPANLRGLEFLGLIDAGGFPTDLAHLVRSAPSDQYPALLQKIVQDAYRPIFKVADPSTATRTQIDDAFRHEKPEAQRSRMVAFFLGLCREAGIAVKEAPQGGRPPKVLAVRVGQPLHRITRQGPRIVSSAVTGRPLDPALVGIVSKISELETSEELESWIAMFRAAFNFVKKLPSKN